MTSPEDVSVRLEAAPQQSIAVWDAVASGWHARREEMWQRSHLVSEWMIR
jgi:urease accessory protein UreH